MENISLSPETSYSPCTIVYDNPSYDLKEGYVPGFALNDILSVCYHIGTVSEYSVDKALELPAILSDDFYEITRGVRVNNIKDAGLVNYWPVKVFLELPTKKHRYHIEGEIEPYVVKERGNIRSGERLGFYLWQICLIYRRFYETFKQSDVMRHVKFDFSNLTIERVNVVDNNMLTVKLLY